MHSLTLEIDGGELCSFTPRPLYLPRERVPGTHWVGGWVSSIAGLDAVVKRKIPSPCLDSNPPSLDGGKETLQSTSSRTAGYVREDKEVGG